MRTREQTGCAGEAQAEAFLKRAGYRILERNYRTRHGEIDLIAQKGDIVAFCEVKTRASSRFAEAREFVTYQKQKRLIAAASLWLMAHGDGLQPRFDVLEVYWPQSAEMPTEIRHLQHAFET